jgi:Tfp pilus assembly protein PilO
MHPKALRRLAGEIIPVLVFSCAVLLSLVLLRFAAAPQWQRLQVKNGEIAHYRTLVSDKNRYQAIKERLLDKKARLSRQYALYVPAQGAPAGSDLSGMLQLLIVRARDADIRFVKMQPQQETQREKQVDYPVVLELTTSYHSLGRFISSLEELPQAVKIERLAVTAGKNGLDVRILVTCFLKKAG